MEGGHPKSVYHNKLGALQIGWKTQAQSLNIGNISALLHGQTRSRLATIGNLLPWRLTVCPNFIQVQVVAAHFRLAILQLLNSFLAKEERGSACKTFSLDWFPL